MTPIDAPRHQYYPFFVSVYRCSGGCSTNSPNTYHCSATTWNNVTGTVFDLQTSTQKVLTVLNHTSCECTCVAKAKDCSENELYDEDTCSCQCKYQDEPQVGCPARFRCVLLHLNRARICLLASADEIAHMVGKTPKDFRFLLTRNI